MEIKVNAIVIKSIDYKDNDKILTLFSLEKGKITAGIKGVKKAGAKLKFASEPFCFAEYILAEKQGRYTVVNATYISSFYELRTNMVKYYTSACAVDVVNVATQNDEPDVKLFTLLLSAVKDICYNGDEKKSLATFLYNFIELLGYGIENLNCAYCGEDILGRVFFRVKDAEFRCENCNDSSFIEITKETYHALKVIKNNLDEDLSDGEKNKVLKFLFYYLSQKLEVKLASATSLIENILN